MSVACSSQPLAAEQFPASFGTPARHPRGFKVVCLAVLPVNKNDFFVAVSLTKEGPWGLIFID